MNDPKHTPTAWAVGLGSVSDNGISILGPDGARIANVFMGSTCDWERDTSLAEANAKLVVQAVNSHAELLAALEDAVGLLDEFYEEMEPYHIATECAITEAARAAIARAKGASNAR